MYTVLILSHMQDLVHCQHAHIFSQGDPFSHYSNTLMYFFIPEVSISFLDRTDYAEYNLFNGKILPQFYRNFGKYLTFWQAYVS